MNKVIFLLRIGNDQLKLGNNNWLHVKGIETSNKFLQYLSSFYYVCVTMSTVVYLIFPFIKKFTINIYKQKKLN